MLDQRYYGSSVTVNGKLWITGGQNAEGKHLNSTEFMSPGQLRTIKGPNLPFGISNHTMVQVNSKAVYIIGGYQYYGIESKKTWIVDPNKLYSNMFDYKEGPDMNLARIRHSCNKMEINGKIYLVVAGHKNEDFIEILDSESPEKGWIIGS